MSKFRVCIHGETICQHKKINAALDRLRREARGTVIQRGDRLHMFEWRTPVMYVWSEFLFAPKVRASNWICLGNPDE